MSDAEMDARAAAAVERIEREPVAWPKSYGPVDPDREPERWAAESKALMNDLALLEPIRTIRFTNAAELAALLGS